ncbi:peptidoglycan-binding domain-containing protein [Asticcacaulis sp.]|uniref:peptidoglycan-binding domain-containing protein n=1 Tax=Asticcacaulis sp. TaxID=1872648 RepID=UPI002BD0BA16|nr:peptidoglycan-binding domain-containing protein [Asticcacaulis sp.]HTM81819.1 peptidoglycan-binding domain-containing protein [Asticcacaulis sp.]
MRKLFLKSGVAVLAVVSVGLAMPALAHTHKPTVHPVSKRFDRESRVAAERTVTVIQTGTSAAEPVQGDVGQIITMTEAAPVACPSGPVGSPEWQQVPEELRKHAIPGQCFSRLLMPPKSERYVEHVLVSPERVETRRIPQVVDMVDEDVMVRPERVERRVIPAVSHIETTTEIVRPASFREERIPAQYELRTEHVMVRDSRREWVRTDGIPTEAAMVTAGDYDPVRYRDDGSLSWPGKYQDGTPEAASYEPRDPSIWCLKVVPGVYEDRTTRVEVAPASIRRIEIPAETRQVRHTVIDAPERYEEVVIPAVMEKRRVRRVTQEARTETYTVPAAYDDVTRERIVGAAEPVWREVICGKNTSQQKVMEVQRALAARGYNPGPIDGQLGRQTVSAMQKFQADNGLPQGQPSVEAVQMLGVPLVPLNRN